jgi:hypothetical protein
MIEVIRKMVEYLPIEEIKDKDILLMKGMYKIPQSIGDVKNQLKYKR